MTNSTDLWDWVLGNGTQVHSFARLRKVQSPSAYITRVSEDHWAITAGASTIDNYIVVSGPFETLEAAQTAYLLLVG